MYLPYDSTDIAPVEPRKRHAKFGNSIIVGGDANAHHIEWGSTDTNQRGEQLLDWIGATNH